MVFVDIENSRNFIYHCLCVKHDIRQIFVFDAVRLSGVLFKIYAFY